MARRVHDAGSDRGAVGRPVYRSGAPRIDRVRLERGRRGRSGPCHRIDGNAARPLSDPVSNQRGQVTVAEKPAVNPIVDDIADQAKYRYATGTKLLAAMQYRLAELAGTGRL